MTRDQWTMVLLLSAPALAFGVEEFAFAFVVFLLFAYVGGARMR